MAWAKWLSTGEVALVAVNFAKRIGAVELPLHSLLAADSALVRDVWSRQRRLQQGQLRLKLPANGGHLLLLLEPANGSEGVEWAAPPLAPAVPGISRTMRAQSAP